MLHGNTVIPKDYLDNIKLLLLQGETQTGKYNSAKQHCYNNVTYFDQI